MRSNSFDTQEVREIGLKEAGASRGFPICSDISLIIPSSTLVSISIV